MDDNILRGAMVLSGEKHVDSIGTFDPFAFDPFAFDPFAFDPFAFDPFAFDPFAFDPFAFDPDNDKEASASNNVVSDDLID